MNTRITQLFLLVILLPFLCLSLETDTISSSLVMKDPDSIVSQKQVFKLGFFTPENTTNRYLGVFYAVSEETVVWAANRETPLKDSSNTLTISKDDGNLLLINSRNQTVWSTNATTSSPTNTTLQILDTGNLVLRDQATGATIWESFSVPNCFLPTMRVSENIKTGKKVFTSSWKNASDPGVGSYTGEIEALSILQYFTKKNGRPFWRSGQWNGLFFIGIKSMFDSYLYQFVVEDDHNGTFYFSAPEGKNLMKMCLNSSGHLVQTLWNQQKRSWITAWVAPKHECDFYGKCGAFGSCNILDSPICSCMRGFEPVNKDEWGRGNWSGGCRRKNQLQCNRDGFFRLPFMKVPDSAEQFRWRQEDDCRNRCLGNCSCIAYAHEPNIGCMLWTHTLIDAQEFNTVGVDLYIRLSASDLDNSKDRKLYIIIPVAAFVSASVLAFIVWCLIVKRKGDKAKDKNVNPGQKISSESDAILLKDESERIDVEQVPFFSFKTLANATGQFHESNLLGRGGFGPVYKGTLANGDEIAVKRLSEASRQGMQEFMNEVIVISKLQHRNLVRLLGFCVEKEEKMLIYEYMSNKSLEICLFDSTLPSQNVLDWTTRFSIIEGIARGILYLHKDSRLTIIHRDLKPSNVLLDEDWNPKISDFGMARIFGGGNEAYGNTARVVGTYGYMAPEYATEGRFSEKSDVYSFGVLVLEIIKGKKNMHYYNDEWCLGLLGCAWKLWSEKNSFAFVDERIANSKLKIEMERCIQMALLCVQEFPKDRPTIQTVVSMLSHEIFELPTPEQPVFAEKWNDSRHQAGCSTNDLTLTVLQGR